MVGDPAARRQWLDDPRRLRRILNSQRLKGIHLAIKSGMLAAETAFDALQEERLLRRNARAIPEKRRESAGSKKSSGRSATSIRDSSAASSPACSMPALQQFTGGRGLHDALFQRMPDTSTEAAVRPAGRWRRAKLTCLVLPKAMAS